MTWVEPWGDFGAGFSDFEQHDRPVMRVGSAFTYNRQDADPTGDPGPEQTLIRLSDGTRLVSSIPAVSTSSHCIPSTEIAAVR